MATQHPDHSSKPYWHDQPFISTQHEAKEAFLTFSELGATEYKWDWEGKLVDESVVERLFGEFYEYFAKAPLGIDSFLTFRLPNPRIDTEFRMGRAFMNMASAASISKHFGFNIPPFFEVILPLTETPEEMLALQEAYVQIHLLRHPLYKLDGQLTNLRVIPLFEEINTIIHSDKILKKYLSLYQKKFKKRPPYMRPYVARSDPALNSGLIPTVLAIKLAFSHYKDLATKTGIPMYPIIGCGSLVFRGGLNPARVKDFAREYSGVRTVTLQSAFRYDYPLKEVQSAIAYLEKSLPLSEAQSITKQEEKKLLQLIASSETDYKSVIEDIAPIINQVASFIPKRRERFLHVGLFGYSRGEGGIKLPRAISFACALYSIGVPPEFIGTGQAIKKAIEANQLELLEKFYLNLKQDLKEAGRFINKANLKYLAKNSPAWQQVWESVAEIESYLKEKLGPLSADDKKHTQLTSRILKSLNDGQSISRLIEQSALLRKSMG